GPELHAVLQVVPDEVLREGPVRTIGTHGGLPHVAMRVDHARHHDAAGGVDLVGAVRHGEACADLGDLAVDDEDVALRQDRVGIVHRQHDPVAEHDGLTRLGYRHDGAHPP